jgi:integrase
MLAPTSLPVPVVPAGADAEALRTHLQRYAAAARGAFADNSARALRADLALFTAWCRTAGLLPLPATAATVAAFIGAMAAIRAPASIRRYVSSIATPHGAAGVASPTAASEVTLALRRLHRAKGRAQAQAAPLNRPLLERLLAAGGSTLRDLRNRALLALAYDTLCRRAELVALQATDLQPGADGAGTILIRRSKTDPEGADLVRFVAPDTMRLLAAWLAAAGIADGPLFRAVPKGGRVGGALDGAEVPRLFKAMARAAAVPAAEVPRISGHSSRVGAAQDMVRHGVELPAIMQAGGWRTAEMVSRYTAASTPAAPAPPSSPCCRTGRDDEGLGTDVRAGTAGALGAGCTALSSEGR